MPVTSTKKTLSATVYYMLTGMVLSWPGLLGTSQLFSIWSQGGTAIPLSLAVIHLLVLGFMLTIAFGVMYQIVPIAFQAPPIPRHVLFWHLPLHTLSVAAMVVGFLLAQWGIVAAGGILLLGLAALYMGLVLYSFRRARNKTAVHRSLVLPVASLWIVLLIGVYQALFPGFIRQGIVITHVLVGGFAFWSGLVLVFSYKLVPMFILSHGYKASLVRTVRLYYAGIVLLLAAVWLNNPTAKWIKFAGAVVAAVGLAYFVMDLVSMCKARKRKRLVRPMYHAFAATFCIVFSHLWLFAAIAFGKSDWLYPAAYLFGFGGLILLMFAYMQKIVPFLWFEYRFSKRPERKTAPLIDDMVPAKIANWAIGVYVSGVIMGLVSFCEWVRPWQSMLSWFAAILLTCGSLVLFRALFHVLTIGGRRPPDDPPAPQ